MNHKRNSITKYNRPPSKNTLNNTYRRIKGFFNWLSEKDGSFPYNMLKLKGYAQERNKDKLPPATSIEDMKKLILTSFALFAGMGILFAGDGCADYASVKDLGKTKLGIVVQLN